MRVLEYDYLIIGHGLAGSILSHFLIERGKKILVIDRLNEYSSSRVAAGLVNPVTGRRVVKSWMAEQLIPYADNFYKNLKKSIIQNFITGWMFWKSFIP